MVLTLTGPSGTGKTSIAKRLIRMLPTTRLLRSFTTRAPRQTDLPGEYEYVSKNVFEAMQKEDAFEWTASYAETLYGTRRDDVVAAVQEPARAWISILVPERIPHVRHVADIYDCATNVKSFFILSPSHQVLEARMRSRGDKPEEIARRIAADAAWAESARTSGLPYIFIEDNNGPIEDKIQAIVSRLR